MCAAVVPAALCYAWHACSPAFRLAACLPVLACPLTACIPWPRAAPPPALCAAEWALDCLKVLLETNIQQNLQIVVNVAKEYTEQLTAEKIIELLESHKSYHGLYFYLGAHIAFSENPEVGFLLGCSLARKVAGQLGKVSTG